MKESLTKKQKLNILRAELSLERSSFLDHWRDLADFISPVRARFFTTQNNKGNRKNSKIIDSTATMASRTLSAGMMGGLTSPSRDWFRLGVQDPTSVTMPAVKSWLDEVNRIIRLTFNQSNLYQALPNVYEDLGIFGTSAVMAEEDMEDVIRFYNFPIGSYMISTDSRGRVNVFYREFRMTVRQLVKKFQKSEGDFSNFSKRVQELWKEGKREQWIDVCHAIVPNDDYDKGKSESKYKKFSSCYWETTPNQSSQGYQGGIDDNLFLRESGYDIFPVMVSRWYVAAEDIYGTNCPGMIALGDIRQIQFGEKKIMQAIEKSIMPPMKAPESMRSVTASILPSAITYTSEMDGRGKFEPVHTVDPRIAEMEQKQAQKRASIEQAFFVNMFLMMSMDQRTQPPTAEEIIEKRSEKMQILGPVLEQINQDLLDPLIGITFDFLLRQNMIPTPPPELQGQPLKVEYISIMAQAQKVLGISNVERFIGFVIRTAMESQNPDALDIINTDVTFSEYADSLGIAQKTLRIPEEIAKIRASRQQAAMAQQQVALADQGAKAAKNLSQADMSKDSALQRLLGSQAGQPQMVGA